MRVMTKWCEELQKCFRENFIIDREEQFRMLDGSTKFMKKDYLVVFQKLLQRQYTIIKKKLEKLMKHNYNSQSQFSKITANEKLAGFMEEQVVVGQFSSRVFRKNQSYLVSHLNNLLHGILTATRDLTKTLKSWNFVDLFRRLSNGDLDLEKFLCDAQKHTSEDEEKKDYFEKIPQIITFLVGDLLRCKCSSNENQIIALFKQIERINQSQEGIFQVVRVKNRLNSGTKDILMNLMYRKTLVIQMQLAIKTGKTKFLECSNHFNHYLYELKRSQFGPLSQLSNIWTNLDFRGSFYLEKMEELNQPTARQDNKKDCCAHLNDFEPIQESFECSRCGVYYSQGNYIIQNIRCKQCLFQMCLKCRLGLDFSQSKQILTFLPNVQSSAQICSFELPNSGLLVNLKTQQKNFSYFKKIVYKNTSYIFVSSNKTNEINKFRILAQIKGNKEEQRFLKDHFIVKSKNFEALVPTINLEQASTQFFLPKQLKTVKEVSKTSISIVKQCLNDQVFHSLSLVGKQYPAVKKINFSENNLANFSYICSRFQNAQIVVLDNNKINEIGKECQKLKEIRELYLSRNNLKRIDQNIRALSYLTILGISNNNLTNLPDSFINLTSLTALDISVNKFTALPNDFGCLKVLTKLNISFNKIKVLPESFGGLISLTTLDASSNELITFPESFGRLTALKTLNTNSNNLTTFPEDFGKLTALAKLDSYWNFKLTTLPESFGNLSALTTLNIICNNLTTLPVQFGNLNALITLDIRSISLTFLPENFGNLSALKTLHIVSNSLIALPESFGNMVSLTKLNINSSKLKALPDNFGRLSALKTLDLSSNELTTLPDSFGNLVALETLNIYIINLKVLPESFCKLTTLTGLKIISNDLKTLPDKFGNLTALEKFYITSNSLITVPESFADLKLLATLNIGWNFSLNALPGNFGNLCGLKTLNIISNGLSALPQRFGNLSTLTELNVSWNKNLTYLPEGFGKLTALTTLNISSNILKSLPESFGNLSAIKILNASGNDIATLPKSFKKLKNLEKLNIFGNNFVVFPQILSDLSLLQLNMGKNKLEIVPQDLKVFKSLKNMGLKQNSLKKIPLNVWGMTQAEQLDLSQNQIVEIPVQWLQHLNLKIIDFRENPISLKSFFRVWPVAKNSPLKLCFSLNNIKDKIEKCSDEELKQILHQSLRGKEKIEEMLQKFMNQWRTQRMEKTNAEKMVQMKQLI